jgi:hypothetical protein
MSFGNLLSLGSATGSRVDSAAKHIMACKLDTKLLGLMRTEGDRETDLYSCLHTSKMKWCMAKDEIVLNTSKAANSMMMMPFIYSCRNKKNSSKAIALTSR